MGLFRNFKENTMNRKLAVVFKGTRLKKWGSLAVAIIIATSLSGCLRNSVSETTSPPTTSSIDNKADWTIYTDGNTVGPVFVKGNDLWAATEGGVVEWNMAAGTYQKYTTYDGLASNYVSGIAQDKAGNLWFVTRGVNEYNGKSWQNLSDIPNIDINNLTISVTAIALDNKNNIYIGMSDGSIYLFDGKYHQIKSPEETPAPVTSIEALVIDNSNNLWSISSEGIQRYSGKSWVDSQDIPGFPQGTLSFIGVDKNDDLWFQDTSDFSSSYLYRYDGKLWEKIEIPLTDSNVQSIAIDNQGNLWCATLGTLNCYNGKTWQTFSCPVRGIDSISVDDSGNIWCGANTNGVLRFDGNSWKTYFTNDIKGINDQTFIAGDSDGNTWVSTGYGLSCFNGKNWEMVNSSVVNATCFLQDTQGNLWFGSGETLYCYNGSSWNIVTPPFGVFGSFNSIVEDNTGGIWVSTNNIVARFDGKSWTTFNVGIIFGVSPMGTLINSIIIDNQNTIWVATSDGILHLDGTDWKIYTTSDGLTENYITGLLQDKSGNIWAYGYGSGLDRYDGSSWQSFLPGDSISDIAQDQNGNIWLATDHGVIKYDGNTFQSYTTADGLLENSIRLIVIDNDNDVWCGTFDGVNYYDGKTWQSFTPTDGLAGVQVLQIVNEKSGDIWFFSIFGGISHYAPAK
jgi:ligand-binding sensor domain-containing protein